MTPDAPLYARGPYRVVALREDVVRRYVVIDLAGAWLRSHPSQD